MLQAQLAESTPDQTKQDDDETLRAALAAASAMNDLGNPPANMAHHPPSQSAETKQEHLSSVLWEDVPLEHQQQRPPLHTHASFASHASHASHASYTSHNYHHEQKPHTTTSSAVNVNAFDANHQHLNATPSSTPEDAHEHSQDHPAANSVSTSSPGICRLLELHNQSFEVEIGQREHQEHQGQRQQSGTPTLGVGDQQFPNHDLGGLFVLVESRETVKRD